MSPLDRLGSVAPFHSTSASGATPVATTVRDTVMTGLESVPSSSAAPHTFADVLCRADAELRRHGVQGAWQLPVAGADLAKKLPQLYAELPNLQDVLDGMVGMGQDGRDRVNEFLRQKGFSIQLSPIASRRDALSAVSVFDKKFQWIQPWTETHINLKDERGQPVLVQGQYPRKVVGVEMKYGFDVLEMEQPKAHILCLNTKTGDKVYMVRINTSLAQDATSHRLVIDTLRERMQPSKTRFDKARFPMVDYSREGDIAELLGAQFGDSGYSIEEAKYQHRLRMNERGGHAQAAAAVSVGRTMIVRPPKEIVIDGPFFMWIEQTGIPVFSAQIQPQDMKNPGIIDGI